VEVDLSKSPSGLIEIKNTQGFRNCLRELNFHIARNFRALTQELVDALGLMIELIAVNLRKADSLRNLLGSASRTSSLTH